MIKGEIKASFHKTNHSILAKILQENIEDQQFIDLYWKLVKAGYAGPPYQDCTSLEGSPCTSLTGSAGPNKLDGLLAFGGGINTILSDIYLNKFDKFISDIKIPGKLRLNANKYYNQLTNNKVYYVRYANKWLIGIIGNKQLSLEIQEKVREFLNDEISLDLEKTQITNITKNQTKFLGVLMTATISKMEDGNQVKFLLPVQDILIKLYKEGYLKNLPKKNPSLKINAITK